MTVFHNNASELAHLIKPGQTLCLAPDYSGCAMKVVVELIRQKQHHLTLIGVPQLGLQGDLLIGASCVSEVDAAAVTLGEYGQARRFTAAVLDNAISMKDSTCPVIHAGLQAAEKGVPFLPLRGILGTDLANHRTDWKTISNPFNTANTPDAILLVPAINPDIALFHAPKADRFGNVWIGVRRELMLMAHASKQTIASVEELVEGNLLDDPYTAAGTIPSLYISDLAEINNGADPVGLFGCYQPDHKTLVRYARASCAQAEFDRFLESLLAG